MPDLFDQTSARLRWIRRVPIAAVLAILFVPFVVLAANEGCYKRPPDETKRLHEILLPVIGMPVGLFLAMLAVPGSSPGRKVALMLIGALGLLFLGGALWQMV